MFFVVVLIQDNSYSGKKEQFIGDGDLHREHHGTDGIDWTRIHKFLGVCGLSYTSQYERDGTSMTIEKNSNSSGFLLVGLGGSGGTYPGIYSITRAGEVNVLLAAYGVSSVVADSTSITVTKSSNLRSRCIWIDVIQ